MSNDREIKINNRSKGPMIKQLICIYQTIKFAFEYDCQSIQSENNTLKLVKDRVR